MKKTKRVLAMLLMSVMLLSAFSCGSVTEDAAELPKLSEELTELGASGGAMVSVDFNTTGIFANYIASIEGVELNQSLRGGTIEDGKWRYTNSAMVLRDTCGAYSRDNFWVEFDFCFDEFVNKNNSAIFTMITDDDGVLNDKSSFYMCLRMNADGTVYHGAAQGNTFKVQKGVTHHYKIEIDRIAQKANVYIDDTLLCSPAYTLTPREYNCFRFIDNSRDAKVWVDNFVIGDPSYVPPEETPEDTPEDTPTTPGTVTSPNPGTVLIKANDGAYVRAGTYADQHMEIADGCLRLKCEKEGYEGSYTRSVLLSFDISSLKPADVVYAPLSIAFGSLITSVQLLFDVYVVDGDAWDGETVTWNTAPRGTRIVTGTKLDMMNAIDLADHILDAVEAGKDVFSIRIMQTVAAEGENTVIYNGSVRPYITVYDAMPEKNYVTELSYSSEENKLIWRHAKIMFDEWYERYQNLAPVQEATMIERDASLYTKTNFASGQSTNYNSGKKSYQSRPFEALTDLDRYTSDAITNAEWDEYGGLMIESLRQTATGYFYTKKIEDRWWIIDPLGYPFISVGLSDIQYSQLGSTIQRDNAINRYGSFEKWAIATTRHMREDLLFNTCARPVSDVIPVEGGVAVIVAPSGVMSSYGSVQGICGDGNGSTVFVHNNTMPVFDPGFETYADQWASTKITHQNTRNLIGYTSDNELPMDVDMLDRSLTVDPSVPQNYYTYACAWTWFCQMTGKDNPGAADITDELRDLFRGFVWDRYFYVVENAIHKYDPDHMYLGCRFLTKVKDSQWVLRFAAQYLDIMTINWYSTWEPQAESLYNIARYGDMPFIVTEFYTKAGDSGLGNTSGAGWYVATQQDRADYYETFTLQLLQSKNAVGWEWFQYMDNDPLSGTGDASSVDSNKGIIASDLSEYTEFTSQMKDIHQNVYRLIEYFDTKYAD